MNLVEKPVQSRCEQTVRHCRSQGLRHVRGEELKYSHGLAMVTHWHLGSGFLSLSCMGRCSERRSGGCEKATLHIHVDMCIQILTLDSLRTPVRVSSFECHTS